jgi:hypothetical protein
MAEPWRHRLAPVVHFFESAGFWWGLGISVALAIGSLALATAVVVAWPATRFKHGPPPSTKHVVVRVLGLVAKNIAGLCLLLLGLVMALPGIPGQGLLTMIIGLTLLDFPGKREVERRVLKHRRVLAAINGLRARFHRPPLEMD